MAAERPPADPSQARPQVSPRHRVEVSEELSAKLGSDRDHIRPTESGIDMVRRDRFRDPQEYWSPAACSPDPKRFTVEVHGSPHGVRIGDKDLSAAELAEIIRASPGYRDGEPVRLLACRTGADTPDGSPNFAQQLAEELGVEVLAPNTNAWVDNYGNMYASRDRASFETGAEGAPRPNWEDPGQWVSFSPDGARAVHDSPHPPGHEPTWVRDGVRAQDATSRGFSPWDPNAPKEFHPPGGPRESGLQHRSDAYGFPVPGHVRSNGEWVPHGAYDAYGNWQSHGNVDQLGRWVPGHLDQQGKLVPNGQYDQRGRWFPFGRTDEMGRWVPVRFDSAQFHDTGRYHPQTHAWEPFGAPQRGPAAPAQVRADTSSPAPAAPVTAGQRTSPPPSGPPAGPQGQEGAPAGPPSRGPGDQMPSRGPVGGNGPVPGGPMPQQNPAADRSRPPTGAAPRQPSPPQAPTGNRPTPQQGPAGAPQGPGATASGPSQTTGGQRLPEQAEPDLGKPTPPSLNRPVGNSAQPPRPEVRAEVPKVERLLRTGEEAAPPRADEPPVLEGDPHADSTAARPVQDVPADTAPPRPDSSSEKAERSAESGLEQHHPPPADSNPSGSESRQGATADAAKAPPKPESATRTPHHAGELGGHLDEPGTSLGAPSESRGGDPFDRGVEGGSPGHLDAPAREDVAEPVEAAERTTPEAEEAPASAEGELPSEPRSSSGAAPEEEPLNAAFEGEERPSSQPGDRVQEAPGRGAAPEGAFAEAEPVSPEVGEGVELPKIQSALDPHAQNVEPKVSDGPGGALAPNADAEKAAEVAHGESAVPIGDGVLSEIATPAEMDQFARLCEERPDIFSPADPEELIAARVNSPEALRGVSDEEISAIRTYTYDKGSCYELNRALRSGNTRAMAEMEPYRAVLASALNKIRANMEAAGAKSSTELAHRKLTLTSESDVASFRDKYGVRGGLVREDAFISATPGKSEHQPGSSQNQGSVSVEIFMHGSSNVDISSLSRLPGENETLRVNGGEFRVLHYGESDRKISVVMEEVAQSGGVAEVAAEEPYFNKFDAVLNAGP